jgi:predicted metal-dependent HD superfamily phosphohydrolase
MIEDIIERITMHSDFYLIEPIRDFFNNQYSQPHRKYHNYTHIDNMFLYASFGEMMLSEEQVVAIYLHDIYYDINSNDMQTNEEKSAIFAYEHMKEYFGYDDKRASIVKNIILDTKDHLPVHGGDWSSPVIDLDLWALFDIKEYKKNAWLIRQEYLCYSWDEFLKGRKKWLKSMVIRDKIYHSPYVRNTRMNELAFNNMNRELKFIHSQNEWVDFIIGK